MFHDIQAGVEGPVRPDATIQMRRNWASQPVASSIPAWISSRVTSQRCGSDPDQPRPQ